MTDTLNSHRLSTRFDWVFSRVSSRISSRIFLATMLAAVATSGSAYAIDASYSCSRGTRLNAQFSAPGVTPGHAILTFRGSQRRLALPQVMSADGGRYANGKVEFWIKGQGATLTRNGKSETCTSQ